MKQTKIYSIVLFSFLLNVCPLCGQNNIDDEGYIKEDSMNLAVLVVDFLTYEFEEANISYYLLCDSCDLDSLPFNIIFEYPMDFGEILYKYSWDDDTLFHGSIIWLGTGEIHYPDQFFPADSFGISNNQVSIPSNAQYYDYWLIGHSYCSEERYKERADSAWFSIDSLLLVNEFANHSFRVGFYAYTPSVGMFNPYVAKWIIFLYYGNDFGVSVPECDKDNYFTHPYPNPCASVARLRLTITDQRLAICDLYSISGSKILRLMEEEKLPGEYEIEINVSDLPAGIYYIRMQVGENVGVRKLVKME